MYIKLQSTCKVCGKQFLYDDRISKGIYCSKVCRYKDHSNIIKNSYTEERRKMQSDNAIKQMQDEKQIQIRKDKLTGVKHSEEWNQHNADAHRVRVDYRKLAFDAHGCVCARCGKQLTPEEAVVHHINGEHYIDELTDNSPENLMVLCRSCHTKLHHEQRDFINKFVGLTQFERAAVNILDGLKRMGFKLDDENFKDTPKRMARAYYEIFEGVQDTTQKVESILNTSFPSQGNDDMVVATNVVAFSMCPHHLLPVEYRVAVAYIPDPNGRVLGLSKLSRLVALLAKQPALQEDYTQQIVNALQTINPQGVAVMVQGKHLCMRMRGVKSVETVVTTSAVSGLFKTNHSTKMEFLDIIKGTFKF